MAAKTYRDSYKTPPGRFTGDILKLSGRNALQAPDGVLDPAERAMGAVRAIPRDPVPRCSGPAGLDSTQGPQPRQMTMPQMRF